VNQHFSKHFTLAWVMISTPKAWEWKLPKIKMDFCRACHLFQGGDTELLLEVGAAHCCIAVWGCDMYHCFFLFRFRFKGWWWGILLDFDWKWMGIVWLRGEPIKSQTRWLGIAVLIPILGGHFTCQISKGHVFQGLPHYPSTDVRVKFRELYLEPIQTL